MGSAISTTTITSTTTTTAAAAAATTTTTTPVVNVEKHKISLEEKSLENKNECDISPGKLGSAIIVLMHEPICRRFEFQCTVTNTYTKW